MEHRLRFAILSLAAGSALALPASATVWSFVGARHQAMGGAGVAVVDDSLAQYWNPAAFAFMQGWDAQLPVSANYSIENRALESLSDLFQSADAAAAALEAIDMGGLTDAQQLVDLLELVDDLNGIGLDGQSLQGNLDVGLLGHVGRFGFGALSLTGANVRPVFDKDRGLGFGTSVASAIDGTCSPACGTPSTAAGMDLADQIEATDPTWTTAGGNGTGGTYADQVALALEQTSVDLGNPDNVDLILQIAGDTATSSGTITGNEAIGADVQGLSTQEFGISYAHPIPMPFFPPLDGRVAVGGVLKYMLGVSYSKFAVFDGENDVGDVVADALQFDNVKTSSNVGLDLGILAQPTSWLRGGLVARNVNSPTFDRNVDVLGQSRDFELEPQVRLGVAVMPLENWIVASDLDLTENASLEVPSFKSRIFSLGTEYTIPFSFMRLVLRLGGYLNTANQQNNDYALTGGAALAFGNFLIELAAGGTFKGEEFITGSNERSELPTRLNVGLGLRWESRPEGTRRHTGFYTSR